MKGFEIKRENEKPIYLFNRFDVVSAIAHAIYYVANPESEMCIPNCAYERAEKEFDILFNMVTTHSDHLKSKCMDKYREIKKETEE